MERRLVYLLSVFAAVASVSEAQSSSRSIIFPNSYRNLNSSFKDSDLMSIVGVKDVGKVLALLGIEDDAYTLGRSGIKYADRAVCQPELRTVEVGVHDGDLVFPECVRVKRCGGCCSTDKRMVCTPTKISYLSVQQARIHYRRKINDDVQVEVHEECRCMCRVKEEHCDLRVQRYKESHCACVCQNEQEFDACRKMSSKKIWDPKECECKCIKEHQCSSGTEFSHVTCDCEEE